MKNKTLISIFSVVIVTLLLSTAIAEQYTKFSSKFVKNFRDCDKYEETITSEFENQNFTTKRNILGWRNGICRYEEIITSPKDQYKLTCNLTSMQVDELYESMKNKSRNAEKYELEIYAPKEEDNGNKRYVVVGTQTIKGNPAYIAWAKIQNNPYFCMPQKLK